MAINIEQFLIDFGITYSTESKNVSQGWFGVQCPFCDDHSDHGGFSPEGIAYNCWRCGTHPFIEALSRLLAQDTDRVQRLLKRYGEKPGWRGDRRSKRRFSLLTEVSLPKWSSPLQPSHEKYLKERNFDPDLIVQQWKIQGTGPISFLEGVDYKFRIIIPIYYQEKLVSFQGRDITDKAGLKYKACPKHLEAIHHKHILYGLDNVWSDRVLVVEGVFDVWRIGFGAVATFGISYTKEQITLLNKFKKVFIIFDPEPQAQEKAKDLAAELFNSTEVLTPHEGDPAQFSSREVRRLRKYSSI